MRWLMMGTTVTRRLASATVGNTDHHSGQSWNFVTTWAGPAFVRRAVREESGQMYNFFKHEGSPAKVRVRVWVTQ